MPEPRFQLLAGATRTPRVLSVGVGAARRERAVPQVQSAWRLLGSNNREMGRSVTAFTSVEDCREAVLRLKQNVSHLTSRVATADRRGQWCWSLFLHDDEIATSARPFSRLREARINLDQFLDKVPDAGIVLLNASPAALARRLRLHDASRNVGPTREAL